MSSTKIPAKPKFGDFVILSLFVILITWHPYFLQGELNLYELGLYLPGIDTILKGGMLFRDCFHLRGPLELYFPAVLMTIFGDHIAVLSTYFYVGTVVTLIVCLIIVQQLFRTRLFFYLMAAPFVARTFPRVAFTFWGGMRYAWGLMAVACAIQFFKKENPKWMVGAGVFAGISLLTSIEIGACAMFGVLVSLIFSYVLKIHDRQILKQAAVKFILGFAYVIVPILLYFLLRGALWVYVENVWVVVTQMQKIFDVHYLWLIPTNVQETLVALVNPANKNFRQLTPVYFYIGLVVYFVIKIRRKAITNNDVGAVCLAAYGMLMYHAAFRLIWASQFEMALQPEKLLYFYVLEYVYLFFWAKKIYLKGLDLSSPFIQTSEARKDPSRSFAYAQDDDPSYHFRKMKRWLINFFFLGIIMSSIFYPMERFSKRFFTYRWLTAVLTGKDTSKLVPLHAEEKVKLNLDRVKGVTVPRWQAEEFVNLTNFVRQHTAADEKILMFPELGAYQFIVDRPFVGRFPMVTFAWFKDEWHEEFMKDLKTTNPQFAIIDKDPGPSFPNVFFKVEKNKQKYDELLDYIKKNYEAVKETGELVIYKKVTK